MANSLIQSPLIIDTEGTTSIKTGPICIETIRWVGATTAKHLTSIQDSNGRVIWASYATSADWTEESVINQWFNGINVVDLDSGKLYIYYH